MKFLFLLTCNVCIEGWTDGRTTTIFPAYVSFVRMLLGSYKQGFGSGVGWGVAAAPGAAKCMFLSDKILFIMLYKF